MEMLTRQNMKNSPLCPEILNRIIHTEKNLADKQLDGLRDILEDENDVTIIQSVIDSLLQYVR